MKFDNITSGFMLMVGIVFVVAFNVVIAVRWIDAIYPSVLPNTTVGFWDAFPLLGITMFIGGLTLALADQLGELMNKRYD